MGGFLAFVFLYDAEMYSNLADGCGDKWGFPGGSDGRESACYAGDLVTNEEILQVKCLTQCLECTGTHNNGSLPGGSHLRETFLGQQVRQAVKYGFWSETSADTHYSSETRGHMNRVSTCLLLGSLYDKGQRNSVTGGKTFMLGKEG